MHNAKSTKLLILSGIVIALLGSFLGYYLNKKRVSDQFVQEAQNKLRLIKASKKVWDLWRRGVYSDLYKGNQEDCPKEKFNSSNSCNEELLKCVLKNSVIKPAVKGAGKIRFSNPQKITRKLNGRVAPLEGVSLYLELGQSHLTIHLKKSCNKLFLPHRIYGVGESSNPGMNERFDNFAQLIFIDKEITPSKGKTIPQMRKACSERGMQLLTSHVLDAASFHPVDLKNNRPQEFLKPLLPWTRRLKSEFLYLAEKDKKIKFKKEYCDFIQTKECEGIENNSLPSWMGLKNPLGGVMEVVRNVIYPDKNLVPSSMHYTIHSPWHRLGLRAMWNGKSFDKRDFNFGEKPLPLEEGFSNLKMGYRCMQEVWQ